MTNRRKAPSGKPTRRGCGTSAGVEKDMTELRCGSPRGPVRVGNGRGRAGSVLVLRRGRRFGRAGVARPWLLSEGARPAAAMRVRMRERDDAARGGGRRDGLGLAVKEHPS